MLRSSILGLLVAVACAGTDPASLTVTTDDGEAVEFRVEIAGTPEERREGLMGRESLDPYDGMAFVWTEPTTSRFWMKDTLIPLSIAFWDEQGRIVAILDMEPCPSEPCPTYEAGTAFVGAIEVERGRFLDLGIEVGDLVELEAA